MQIIIQNWKFLTKYIIIHKHGSITLNIYPEVQEWGGRAWAYSLYVDEKYRRKGIAKKLLYEAERITKECGCDTLTIEWEESETPRYIFAWYLTQGYEVSAQDENSYELRKQLT